MEIHTLWGRRRGAEDAPIELISAYDEYTVEESCEVGDWFDLAIKEKDLVQHQVIIINVDEDAIQHAFDLRPNVDATVKENN